MPCFLTTCRRRDHSSCSLCRLDSFQTGVLPAHLNVSYLLYPLVMEVRQHHLLCPPLQGNQQLSQMMMRGRVIAQVYVLLGCCSVPMLCRPMLC